jgi:hypothetical protein
MIAAMNTGRILRRDPAADGRIVSKLLLGIGGERPFGCYSLHFGSLSEMSAAVLRHFSASGHFDAVSQFVSDAQRANGDAVPLPGASADWLKFLHQNEARLGKYSRALD